jgi:endothelin-converting enzyme
MRNILESGSMMDPEGQFDHQVLRKLRDLYNSCMDENELDLLGVTPLLKVTRRIRELFRPKTMAKNMTNEKQESHGLTASIVYLHNIGMHMHIAEVIR